MCGCLVHAKRKFHEAWKINAGNKEAKQGEAYLQKLFSIESKADKCGCDYEARLQFRQTESRAILEAFYTWLDQIEEKRTANRKPVAMVRTDSRDL